MSRHFTDLTESGFKRFLVLQVDAYQYQVNHYQVKIFLQRDQFNVDQVLNDGQDWYQDDQDRQENKDLFHMRCFNQWIHDTCRS